MSLPQLGRQAGMIGQGVIALLAEPRCGIFNLFPRQAVDNPGFAFALL